MSKKSRKDQESDRADASPERTEQSGTEQSGTEQSGTEQQSKAEWVGKLRRAVLESPLLEDVRQVEIRTGKILCNGLWTVLGFALLTTIGSLLGVMDIGHLIVALLAVAGMCAGCWCDAVRKLAYARQFYRDSTGYKPPSNAQ